MKNCVIPYTIYGQPLTLVQLMTPSSRHRGISLSSPPFEWSMKSSCSAETKEIVDKVINKNIILLKKTKEMIKVINKNLFFSSKILKLRRFCFHFCTKISRLNVFQSFQKVLSNITSIFD